MKETAKMSKEKFSTGTIKKLINTWLSTEEVANVIKEFYYDDGSIDKSAIVAKFSNGSQWSRIEKRRLGSQWNDYINLITFDIKTLNQLDKSQHYPMFTWDTFGGENTELVKEMYNNSTCAEKCWLRTFIPIDEMLCDNFQLVVMTCPDDTEIVGWSVISD